MDIEKIKRLLTEGEKSGWKRIAIDYEELRALVIAYEVSGPGFAHIDYHMPTWEPKNIEIKTIGQLLDELITEHLKIWHLVERAEASEEGVQKRIQNHNGTRNELVRALDKRFGQRDIGGKV